MHILKHAPAPKHLNPVREVQLETYEDVVIENGSTDELRILDPLGSIFAHVQPGKSLHVHFCFPPKVCHS